MIHQTTIIVTQAVFVSTSARTFCLAQRIISTKMTKLKALSAVGDIRAAHD